MKALDTLTLPLDKICLIEASAGTGKTYTMANLYVRLLLGVNCPQPLTVEQILVVTFTVAATQELKDRIRLKTHEVAALFRQVQAGENPQEFANDTFLQGLYAAVESDLDSALLRLKIAEQEIDLASIFTIDSFCQKMLLQFAFDSGVRFDIQLQTDQSGLFKRLSEEVWRELFYPLNVSQAEIVAGHLGGSSPEAVLDLVRPFIEKALPELENEQRWISQDFTEYVQAYSAFYEEAKAYWRNHSNEIKDLIGSLYGPKRTQERLAKLDDWANSAEPALPKPFDYFCQEVLIKEKGEAAPKHAHFVKLQHIFDQSAHFSPNGLKAQLRYAFLNAFRQKYQQYKQTHRERSFSDILFELNHALKSEQGDRLARHIRTQFPFAMVDEFQDTNLEQFEVFQRIFMHNAEQAQGFVMIGDPKQSIYKFRGADIFTYIAAAGEADEVVTLDRNWRSVAPLVENTNKLFDFNRSFIYPEIGFHPVGYRDDMNEDLGGDTNYHCYFQQEGDQELAAKQCAYQIQQQLKRAESGQFYLQKKGEKHPLATGDFAVLVRTTKQGMLIKQALAECHIQSVMLSERRSVYATKEAQDLLLVLHACLSPYDQRAVLAALGSNLWYLTASQIFEIKHHENRWEYYVGEFLHYQQIWQQQGILPMLHHIFLQQKILERIKAGEDAPRRITNLFHLAELLQSAMPSLENETALLRWYEAQLKRPAEGQDDQTLRLESEENLVKIVTIHGSKGLQYPVVWLPFVGHEGIPGTKKGVIESTNLAIYRDEKNQQKWSLGGQDNDIKELIAKEICAEDLRLLYVAMTRAEYQLNMILPTQFSGAKWNAMLYLLADGALNVSGKSEGILPTKAYLERKAIQYREVELSEEIPSDDWQPKIDTPAQLEAATFSRKLQQNGRITSFSALHAQSERISRIDHSVQDYDYLPLEANYVEEEESGSVVAYQFPQGMKVGKVLHSFFEESDFSKHIEDESVQRLCEQVGLDEAWFEPTKEWLSTVLNTKFGNSPFALAEIGPKMRLNELQFYMRLANPEALPSLNALLKKHCPQAENLSELKLDELEGFVVGFIDCVAKVNGKFYILDYKSNYLGAQAQDYSAENIKRAMGKYRYDLQYLLYTLALHRYLRQRLGAEYEYERDFGGVAYLFLRGMNGTENSGVYFDKPSAELIEEMDALFG